MALMQRVTLTNGTGNQNIKSFLTTIIKKYENQSKQFKFTF